MFGGRARNKGSFFVVLNVIMLNVFFFCKLGTH